MWQMIGYTALACLATLVIPLLILGPIPKWQREQFDAMMAEIEHTYPRYDDDGKDMSRIDYARLWGVAGRHGIYVGEPTESTNGEHESETG